MIRIQLTKAQAAKLEAIGQGRVCDGLRATARMACW